MVVEEIICALAGRGLNFDYYYRTGGVDDKTALHYLHILRATGLVRLLFSPQRGSCLLRNPEKGYLDNTSLLHALCSELGQEVERGTVRELFFLSALQDAGERVFYSKEAGDFRVGDMVCCVDPDGVPFARGLVNYKASDIQKLMGLKTSQIEKQLGHKHYDEVVHRDNLVMTLDETEEPICP